ncbi:MAG: hypothetical protein J2P21_03300 [Chloracidobacterium sp.]|nr:hypothetical protein [Chloracidobacterium sp.]
MRILKIATVLAFVVGLCSSYQLVHTAKVEGKGKGPSQTQSQTITEAPTAFDNTTNGLVDQATHDIDRANFVKQEQITDGLGPIYDARSCGECHDNPTTGGSAQFVEIHVGHFDGAKFIAPPGGDQIPQRAIDPAIQARVPPGNEVRAFRLALPLFGDGYIECIASDTLVGISQHQPADMRGEVIQGPVLEAGTGTDVARFGWKNITPSLVTFASVAYLVEEGITNPLQPMEALSNGRSTAAFDTVADPEDNGSDIASFTQFIRSLKAPSRDATLAATATAQAGEVIFNKIGCAICHVTSIVTAPPGATVNAGTFTVPPALGNKRIHPFSDFLLHNIGTGDGIVQFGPQDTRLKIRTAPLWGLRARPQLMHDGLTFTRNEAILRHAGEATRVIREYKELSVSQKSKLLTFLDSL